MRVIHGVWAHGLSNHGALCLWAEDPDLPPRSGTEAATPSGMHLPRPHPFACQATELADLLAGSPPGSVSTSAGDAVRKAVHLGSGENPVIDVSLQLGDTSQSVVVTADAPLINSENASVGQAITTREVEDLPLNGRTPLVLASLSTGVLATGQPSLIHPFDSGAAAGWTRRAFAIPTTCSSPTSSRPATRTSARCPPTCTA